MLDLDYLRYRQKKKKLVFAYNHNQISKEEFREKKKNLQKERILKKCRLGVAYNLFDGEELLEASILSIRSVASYIAVVWQKVSNFGEQANPKLEELLTRLKNQGLIDELYLYQPKFNQKQKTYNERCKRDIGLQLVRKAGCNYFLSMDTDEFYHAHQIEDALCYIHKHKINTSAVSIIEYLKKPTYQIVNGYTFSPTEFGKDFVFYCPFIMKVYHFKKQLHGLSNFPCLTDPIRTLNNRGKFYLFSKHLVVMHHMSTIRTDLTKKYKNSNLRKGENKDSDIFQLKEDILSYQYRQNLVELSLFNGLYVQKVPNVFNISITKEKT